MARKKIDRVALRPDPALWGEDEIMTVAEAARLHWPGGYPVSEKTIRRAVAEGRVAISKVAGKHFLTRRSLSALSICEPVRPRERGADETPAETAKPRYLADLAAIRRLGR